MHASSVTKENYMESCERKILSSRCIKNEKGRAKRAAETEEDMNDGCWKRNKQESAKKKLKNFRGKHSPTKTYSRNCECSHASSMKTSKIQETADRAPQLSLQGCRYIND